MNYFVILFLFLNLSFAFEDHGTRGGGSPEGLIARNGDVFICLPYVDFENQSRILCDDLECNMFIKCKEHYGSNLDFVPLIIGKYLLRSFL